MANSIETKSKLWILNTSELISAAPICIHKVQMIVNATSDVGTFYSLFGSTATDHDNYFTNLTFNANTYTILDAATGNKWTNIAANDWVHITECSIAANDGWWYLKTDGGDSTFDIEHTTLVRGVARVLTAGTSATARIRTYTPEICMKVIADNISTLSHPVPLDWGDKGRWFENLSYLQGSSDTHEIYLYIK